MFESMKDSVAFLWVPDLRDTSSHRAEVARVEGFELIAFAMLNLRTIENCFAI
jgi:hypothetical protein